MPNPTSVKGIVFAAGYGRRLLPITETVPKALLPVGNVPLIGYSLKLLAHYGINHVGVSVHHLAKVISDTLQHGEAFGVCLSYSLEDEILGTGGGLRRMRDHLDTTTVVTGCDVIVDVDLHAAIAEHRQRGAIATMVLREPHGPHEIGNVEIDQNNRIVRILCQGQVPLNVQTRSLLYTGVHIVEPRFLEFIPPDVHTCMVRYGYVKALNNDEALFGHVINSYYADAGTPQSFYQANADALAQQFKLPYVDPLGGFALMPKREVAEVVRMGQDVDLGPGVQLFPPVLLGDLCRIAERAVVGPGTILGAGVSVGKDVSISNSIVLADARIEAGTRLEKMLVGKKTTLNLADTSDIS